MDEAERCHKLAILEDGVKRADGTPEELMNNMAAHVIEISAPELRQLKQHLMSLPEVITASQLGARLRVLIHNTVTDPIGFIMQHSNLTADFVDLVRPSLEDVFVTCTGNSRQ